jgi:hypothetical protein
VIASAFENLPVAQVMGFVGEELNDFWESSACSFPRAPGIGK